jgi:phage terminase large subunit-like protein
MLASLECSTPSTQEPSPQENQTSSEPPVAPDHPEWILDAENRGWHWARRAWDMASAQPGSWYDHDKAQAVVEMWPKVFVFTEDRFAGKSFKLTFWEEVIVRLLVGWKTDIEMADPDTGEVYFVAGRLFRRLLLWVARKAGKSEFMAALALLFFALDGVPAGQGFTFAQDEEQARAVFDKMRAMVEMSPVLSRDIQAQAKVIWVPSTRSAFKLLAGNAKGKHGKHASVVVGDEMHEWTRQTLELSDTLRQSFGARLQPIELYASTAGLISNEVGHELWRHSLGVMNGDIQDATTLVVIFAIDEDDDWADEKVWMKANPSLGVSPLIGFLRTEAAKAKISEAALARFRRYHLNQWVENIARWLPRKKWNACAPVNDWKAKAERLRGRKCFGALDISAKLDLTCLGWLFPPEKDGDRFELILRFWMPEEQLKKRVAKGDMYFERWRQMGAIECTPGDIVDQDYIKQAMITGVADFDVQALGYDPWNSTKLVTDLQKDGFPDDLLIEMRQGHKTLGEPTKRFEEWVYAGLIDHGQQPVLAWQAGHVCVRFDENMNYVPDKKRASDKIDGIYVAVMTTALWMAEPVVAKSPWEDSDYKMQAG